MADCKKCNKCKKTKCSCVIQITPKHFKRGQTYTINKSGVYKIKCNIVFNPTMNGQSAIVIAAGVSNVDLNFDDFVLSQNPSSTSFDNFGILIETGCSNISIYDGTIQGFSASQIKGVDGLNTINIRDMTLMAISQIAGGSRVLSETSSNGIYIVGTNTNISRNINISNVRQQGIYLNNPNIPDLRTAGFNFVFCDEVRLNRSLGNQNTYAGPVTTSVGHSTGILCTSCSNVNLFKCETNDNHAPTPNVSGTVTGDASGTTFFTSTNVVVKSCVSNNNGGTRRCGGFIWSSGNNNFLAESCVAANNNVTNPGATGVASHYGFEIVGTILGLLPNSNGVIRDCQVNGQSACFAVFGSSNILYDSCTATAGNLANTIPANNGAFGFMCTSAASNIDYLNCVATGFQDSTGTAGKGLWLRNRAGSAPTQVNIRKSKSINNHYGLLVDSGTTKAIVDSNEFAFNTINGVLDSNSSSTNVYLRNLASSNGSPTSLANNYVGLPAGTPVRTWTIGAAPSPTDNNGILDPIDNLSVAP